MIWSSPVNFEAILGRRIADVRNRAVSWMRAPNKQISRRNDVSEFPGKIVPNSLFPCKKGPKYSKRKLQT